MLAHPGHTDPTGRWNLLVLRVDFSDAPGVRFTSTEFRDQWVPVLQGHFNDMSNGQLDLRITLVENVLRLGPRRYYHSCRPDNLLPGEDPETVCRAFWAHAVDLAVDSGEIQELPEGLAPLGASVAEEVFDGFLVVTGSPDGWPLPIYSPCGSSYRSWAIGPVCVNRDAPYNGSCSGSYPGGYQAMITPEDGYGDCNVAIDPVHDAGPAVHELGHGVTWSTGSAGAHPAEYSNRHELMDSCYPCVTGAYTRVGAGVKGIGFADWFPGWIDDGRIAVTEPDASAPFLLDPIELDPDVATEPLGLRVGVIDGRAYWAECRRFISWDAATPIPDEGVLIQRATPVGRLRPGELEVMPPPGGTIAHLWKPGDTFNDPNNDVSIIVGADVGDQCKVTVSYGPLSTVGIPDVGLTPWLTPPQNTWETIDIWVDSRCNGYEDEGGVLRYGRYPMGDPFAGEVIGNGDDVCANGENRVYGKITNYGAAVATNVIVEFYRTDPLGVGVHGAEGWTLIGTADSTTFPELASIGLDETVTVWVPWEPMVTPPPGTTHFPFHSCLQIKVRTLPDERLTANQDGPDEQENIDYFQARLQVSGDFDLIDREITLRNPENEGRWAYIESESELPPDWMLDIAGGQQRFWLEGNEVIPIRIRIQVPSDAGLGRMESLYIRAFLKTELLDELGDPVHYHNETLDGVLINVHTVRETAIDLTAAAQPPDSCAVTSIVADGCLSSATPGTPLTLILTDPLGVETTKPMRTDGTGCFHEEFAASGGGQYGIEAFWHGDDVDGSATSGVITVSAADPDDLDCDTVLNIDDNCIKVANPNQTDFDGDGAGDDCDCDPMDPGVREVPGEIANLRFDSPTLLRWDSAKPSSGPSTVHEVLSGSLAELPVGNGASESCLMANIDADAFEITQVPASGEGLWFLLRGSSDCGDGPLGPPLGPPRATRTTCVDCAHDKCATDGPLVAECDPCVQQVCAADSFCCDMRWDPLCVQEVRTICGSLVCSESQGQCDHTLCSTGAALAPECDAPPATQSCATQICDVDAFCCQTAWDELCVDEVQSICGNNCE